MVIFPVIWLVHADNDFFKMRCYISKVVLWSKCHTLGQTYQNYFPFYDLPTMTKGTRDSSKTMEKYVDTLVLAIPGFSNKL